MLSHFSIRTGLTECINSTIQAKYLGSVLGAGNTYIANQRCYLLLWNQNVFCFSASVAFVLVSEYLYLGRNWILFLLAVVSICLLSLPQPCLLDVYNTSLLVTEMNAGVWLQRDSSSSPDAPLPQLPPCCRLSSADVCSSQQGTRMITLWKPHAARRWSGSWYLLRLMWSETYMQRTIL